MMGTRNGLAPRWYSSLGDKKLIVSSLRQLLPDIKPNRRGQPPKHPIKDYLLLIVLKEFKKSPLRGAETDWSEYVCGERIDHSVIHYWERNLPSEYIEQAVRLIGSRLEELIGYEFSVIDATAFSGWHHDTTSVFGLYIMQHMVILLFGLIVRHVHNEAKIDAQKKCIDKIL